LYKKEVYIRNKGYNEKLLLVEDFDFWLRALKHSKAYKIKTPDLYYYRYHPESLTIKMNSDQSLKNDFIRNLQILYDNLFEDFKLKGKEPLIKYIIERFLNGPFKNIEVINNKFLLRDLHIIANGFSDFNSRKLKSIAIEDTIETILKNERFHNMSILKKLHSNIGLKLLYLPTRRYLALWKKCLI